MNDGRDAGGVRPAQLRWSESGQPVSGGFDDVYFSREDGLAETRHVFIDTNRLTERFAALPSSPEGPTPHFTLAETGFGTGLNFLACWDLWRKTAPAGARLHFVSVEKHPLERTDLARALALWPELAPLARQLETAYPPLAEPGFYRLHLAADVTLTLIFDEASAGLNQLLTNPDPRWREHQPTVDAWLLDGFAPAKNPAMWSEALFETIGQLSGPGTTAATFSAAGVVKRGLKSAGFAVRKVPGFGRKREMVAAEFDAPVEPAAAPRERDLTQRPTHTRGGRAVVIGAGLAGCHTARALAERGWQVEVLERADTPARGGSGNRQGLVYAKLSHRRETLPLFNLSALTYAQHRYAPFWREHPDGGRQCGLLQLATTEKTARAHRAIADQLGPAQSLVHLVDARQASERAGLTLPHGGLYFPGGGWLDPRALCHWLLNHPRIRVRYCAGVADWNKAGSDWQLRDSDGETLASASVVIVCSAHEARALPGLSELPTKPIRGQVTHLPATDESRQLRTALCARGYLAPAGPRGHCAGASFNLGETDLALSRRDHETNLAHLREMGPAVADLFPAPPGQEDGRAAFRCTTPDYLPIAGPVPDWPLLRERFAPLGQNAKADIRSPMPYQAGLYVNIGHGSRGLAYTPVCAELLASTLTGEPAPLPATLTRALHPARFAIRAIIRGQ